MTIRNRMINDKVGGDEIILLITRIKLVIPFFSPSFLVIERRYMCSVNSSFLTNSKKLPEFSYFLYSFSYFLYSLVLHYTLIIQTIIGRCSLQNRISITLIMCLDFNILCFAMIQKMMKKIYTVFNSQFSHFEFVPVHTGN